MSNDNMKLAVQTYNTICDILSDLNLKFSKLEDKLAVNLVFNGDDLPIDLYFAIDHEKEFFRLISFMPFSMDEDKRVEGAVVTSVANFGMPDGHFVYDITDGSIMYKQVASYTTGKVGKALIEHMIALACAMIERYNDRFFAVNKGFMSVTDFIAKEG